MTRRAISSEEVRYCIELLVEGSGSASSAYRKLLRARPVDAWTRDLKEAILPVLRIRMMEEFE